MNNRINYIDYAKAFGMFFIVVAHAYTPVLRNIGYMFMVPIFFILNGYVFNLKKQNIDFKYYKNFVLKKIKTLWLPFFIYSVLFILLHNVFLYFGIYTSNNQFLKLAQEHNQSVMWGNFITNFYTLKDMLLLIIKSATFKVIEQFSRPLWFIAALFTADIIYVTIIYISNKLKNTMYKNIFILVAVLLIFALGYLTHFPRFISSGLVGVLLVYIGNKIKKYDEKIPYNIYLSILCCIIVIIMSRFTHVGMMGNTYTNPITFLISSLCGTYAILYISRKIDFNLSDKNLFKRFLSFFGKNTFAILGLHLICFKIITLLQIIIYKDDWIYLACYPVYLINGVWTILYILVGISIPLILKFIQIKLKNKISFINIKKRKLIKM